LKYQAAFPLLLNISDQPTYFMALKDGAGLVKKYAMVNVQKYQTVAIGDTVAECEKNYEKLLADNGIASGVGTESDISMTGTIEKMAQAVIEGNSHFYITLGGENAEVKGLEAGQTAQKYIFDIPVTEYPEIVGYDVGDSLTVHFIPEEPISTVTALGDKKPETGVDKKETTE
jgi:hypothetical protein